MTPNELPFDAVGLWQIIPKGRHDFGLSGDKLIDFTRRHILALLARGAHPIRFGESGDKWEVQTQYGATPEEIAEGIIAEWLASGQKDPDVEGLWFGLPEFYLND